MKTGTDAKHQLCVKPEGGALDKPVVFALTLLLGHSDGYYEGAHSGASLVIVKPRRSELLGKQKWQRRSTWIDCS